jgi:hypothetical protein
VTRSTALRVRADACARRRARTPPFPFGGSIVTRVDRKDAGEIIRIVSVKLYFETKDPKRVRGKSTLTGLAERSRASTDRGVGRCRKRDPDEAHLPARANARGSRPRARTRGHAGRESSPSSPRSSPRRPRRRVHALPRAPRPRALAHSVSERPASLTPGAELPGERTRAEGTPSRAHHARDSTPDRRARGSRRPPAPTVQPRGPPTAGTPGPLSERKATAFGANRALYSLLIPSRGGGRIVGTVLFFTRSALVPRVVGGAFGSVFMSLGS